MLVLEPDSDFGRTYDAWEDVPPGNVVHVHGKGFYLKIRDIQSATLFTGQKNGPAHGWMFYEFVPRGPFREVLRISYAGS